MSKSTKVPILYTHGVGKHAKVLAKEAINYKLFKENWTLIDNLLECLQTHSSKRWRGNRHYFIIAAAYRNNDMLGVCLIKGNWISLYIDKRVRRQGIATELMNVLIQYHSIDQYKLVASTGLQGSEKFWLRFPFISLK